MSLDADDRSVPAILDPLGCEAAEGADYHDGCFIHLSNELMINHPSDRIDLTLWACMTIVRLKSPWAVEWTEPAELSTLLDRGGSYARYGNRPRGFFFHQAISPPATLSQ